MPETPAAHRAPPSAFPVGRSISGRYRLDHRIARGGMAEVWEATDEVLGRRVAVKILHPHLAADDTFVGRFRTEAIAAARLHHPGIVAIYDTCHDDDAEAIVMELVKGTTLRAVLDERPLLQPDEVTSIGAQVADALGAAHRAGLVHRDIKPANILVCDDGRVLVTDFGIAKIRDDPDVTQTGTMLGTVKYLAPEQVRGERLDGRADIYALGVVMYESLCARAPFAGETPAATALARLHQVPPRPRQVRATVPLGLDAVVMRCLQLDPARRYASAPELRAALLEPGTTVDPSDLTVATTVDPTRAWAPASNGAAAGSVPQPVGASPVGAPTAAGGAAPASSGVIVEEPPSRWVRSALVAAFVIGALGLAGVLVARTNVGHTLFSWADSTTSSTVGGSDPSSSGGALHITGVTSFDPGGSGTPGENDNQLAKAIDGNPATGWRTESYDQRRFGTKDGVGVVVTLDQAARLRQLHVTSPTTGWSAAIYVAPSADVPSSLAGWGDPVTDQQGIDGDATFDLHGHQGQSVLIWITDLGDAPPRVRAEIDELAVTS